MSIELAEAINSFAPVAQQTDVSPSEESAFILTSSQLSAIITAAVEKAIQPLQDRIEALEATVDRQDEKIAALESTQDTQADNQLIQLRLINDLREATKKEPQPLQKDRGDILRALLAANGGKMLATDARKKMHLSRSRFSELLATVKDEIEVKPYHLRKNWKVLILK
jgi:uncharacterized membrane protein